MCIIKIMLLIALYNSIMSRFSKKSDILYCGIVAFSGKTNYNVDKIQELLVINGYTRGDDSTGFYNPAQGLHKTTGHAVDFLIKNTIEEASLFIGHLRSKTVGVVSERNAHPFKVDNIIACHNGTLTNHAELFNSMGVAFKDWSVDSEVFAYGLAKYQNPLIFSKVKGAMAVVFTDVSTPDVLYVFRNSERPLHYGYIDENMYISSEEKPLQFIGCTKITAFDADYFYKIKNGKIKKEFEIKNIAPKSTTYTYGNSMLDYKNKFVLCDTDSGAAFPVLRGHYYFCKGVDEKNMKITVIDAFGEDKEVDRTKFSYNADKLIAPVKGMKILAKSILYYVADDDNPNKTPVCKKGDSLEIVSIEYGAKGVIKAFKVLNKLNSEEFTMDPKWALVEPLPKSSI